MYIRRDEGSQGGGTGAAGDADPKGQNQGADGDKGSGTDADGKVDWNVEGPKLKTGMDDLNAKFDKQANELGELRNKSKEYDTWQEALKTNPKTAFPALAKEHGHNVELKEPVDADTLMKQMQGDGDGKVDAKALVEVAKHLGAATKESILKEMEPTITAVHHEHLRKEFPDFDKGSDGRSELQMQYKAGLVPQDKLFHLAWRGLNLDEAVKAAVGEAEKAKEAEYAKKLEEAGLPGGSASQSASSKPRDDGRQTLRSKVQERTKA